jgi:hypothetical protein
MSLLLLAACAASCTTMRPVDATQLDATLAALEPGDVTAVWFILLDDAGYELDF